MGVMKVLGLYIMLGTLNFCGLIALIQSRRDVKVRDILAVFLVSSTWPLFLLFFILIHIVYILLRVGRIMYESTEITIIKRRTK
jgi:hypothetical protein